MLYYRLIILNAPLRTLAKQFKDASVYLHRSLLFSTIALTTSALSVTGCNGSQSTFRDAGEGAKHISNLFLWMVVAATIVWIFLCVLGAYAYFSNQTHDPRWVVRTIITGGFVVPSVALSILLSFGLAMLPRLLEPPIDNTLNIEVSGVRWWWRVTYHATSNASEQSPNAATIDFETANEIVLPLNTEVELNLTSEDVIHSFWIPSLSGKVDMIPGRGNRLKLLPLKVGTYRGVCAEFCGDAHSQMAFIVKVVSENDFREWTVNQNKKVTLTENINADGLELFLEKGCSACHAIRGTDANGRIGPDLTHIGSRNSLGAGWLPNSSIHLNQWIRNPDTIKPGVEMPSFDFLSKEELITLSKFLEGLQ